MTPKRARELLRGMNRRERRETLRGLWLLVDGAGRRFAVNSEGLTLEVDTAAEATGGEITLEMLRNAMTEPPNSLERPTA